MIPPTPVDEAARLEALQQLAILDTLPEAAFDDILWVAAYLCRTPIALISLVDADRQWFKSRIGLDAPELARDISFCTHTIGQADLFVVPDAADDERFRHNPLVTSDPHIRFYAGAPLVTAEGHSLGTLCVLDRAPRQLGAEERAVLGSLSRLVVAQLELHHKAIQQARLIAERDAVQETLRHSEERYRHLVTNATDIIYQTDATGHFIYFNETAVRLLGYSAGEISGRHYLELVGPAHRRKAARFYDRQFARRIPSTYFEFRAATRDGAEVWLGQNVQLLFDGDRVLGFQAVARDVTERRRAEAALREAHEALRHAHEDLEQQVRERTRDLTDANGALRAEIAERRGLEAEREKLLAEALERADRCPLTGLINHRAFHHRLAAEAERALRENAPLAIALIDLDNFRFFNDAYGHAVGDDLLRRVAAALNSQCGPCDTLSRFGGDEFALLLPGTAGEEAGRLAGRLAACLDGVGYRPPAYETVIPLSLSVGIAVFPEEAATRQDALALADARLRRAKSGGDGGSQADRIRGDASRQVEGFSMLDALVTAVDNKDRYTRRHSEDVMTYSLELARELDLGERTRHVVAVAALLHDVGKIGVPDHILRKPGRLTEEEFAAVRQHPVMGAVMVGAVPGLEETLDAVRLHHERWDGGGYPGGLRGEETPLLARLMAVADAYSAMTTDRPYRTGMPAEQALAILEAGAGTQWDPACVRAFFQVRARLARGNSRRAA